MEAEKIASPNMKIAILAVNGAAVRAALFTCIHSWLALKYMCATESSEEGQCYAWST